MIGFKTMQDIVIKLTNISKKYVLHHEKPTLVENIFSRKTKEEFWALKKINIVIKKGEKVGIVGHNGSGKTTLLEIISGITVPTTGKIATSGRLATLIELEAGFHPDLTGEENIYFNGLMIGMSKNEIRANFKKIISFADIGVFIDAPMYTYSEGMKLKLGFSIMVHANPDILVLDENMAVGDRSFHNKSYSKIEEFIEQNKTIIVVTHYLEFLKKKCDRVIWLKEGKIIRDGGMRKVIKEYEQSAI